MKKKFSTEREIQILGEKHVLSHLSHVLAQEVLGWCPTELEPKLRTLQHVFLKQGAMESHFLVWFHFFFLYRGKFTIPKLSSNSFVTHWFTCAARAAIFHSNLNISDLSHREDALAPQHTEHPQEPPPQDLGKIWGKWEMACSTDSLAKPEKTEWSLFAHLSGLKPTSWHLNFLQ